jgi:hypothetical protein
LAKKSKERFRVQGQPNAPAMRQELLECDAAVAVEISFTQKAALEKCYGPENCSASAKTDFSVDSAFSIRKVGVLSLLLKN